MSLFKLWNILCVVIIFSSIAKGQEPSALQKIASQWDQTNIPKELGYEALTTKECKANSFSLNGCFHAIKTLIETLSEGKKTVLLKSDTHPKYIGKTLHEYGDLEVVEVLVDQLPVSFSSEEEFEYYASNIRRFNDLSKNINQIQIPFENIRDDIFKSVPNGYEKFLNSLIINAYVQNSFDSHYAIELADEYEDLKQETRGETLGVGILFHIETDSIFILKVFQDSPAFLAGLKKQDQVLQINGTSVKNKSLSEVSNLLSGPDGTVIEFLVQRGSKNLSLKITKTNYQIKNLNTEIVSTPDNGNALVVSINDFMQEDLCKDFTQKIQKNFQENNFKSLVIDLRGNPGGRVDQTLCMIGSLLDKKEKLLSIWNLSVGRIDKEYFNQDGNLIGAYYEEQKSISLLDNNNIVYYETPILEASKEIPNLSSLLKNKSIVVLVNQRSASASEIFSGIVQDLNLGVVVGTKTYGKGSVQAILESENGFLLKKTTGRIHLPSGRSYQKIGIIPDIEVFMNDQDKESDTLFPREYLTHPFSPPTAKQTTSLQRSANHFEACQAVQDTLKENTSDQQMQVALAVASCL